MKKLMIGAAIALSCNGIYADLLDNPLNLLKKPLTYEESGIGFELVNKAKRAIWVSVADKEGATRPQKIEAAATLESSSLQLKPDTRGTVVMAVWYSAPKSVSYEPTGLGLFGPKKFSPKPDKLYSFEHNASGTAPWKTIYLTWDAANYARPQTGPAKGILGKTDSNLSMKQNVLSSDIKELTA